MINWFDSLPEVPGDPGAIRRFTSRLSGAADALDGHSRRLEANTSSLVGGGSWDSPAAVQFAYTLGSVVHYLRGSAEAYRAAAAVLARYASILEAAQAYRRTAQSKLDNAKVESGVVTLLAAPLSGLEAFNPDVKAAHAMAAEAVQVVRQAAAVTAVELESIAGLPVHMPSAPAAPKPDHHWYDGFANFGQDLGEGLYQGVLGPLSLGWSLTGRASYDSSGAGATWQALGNGLVNDFQHPDQFAKSLIDWNDWTSGHPGRAIGNLLPTVIITVITFGVAGGAAGAVRGGVGPVLRGQAGVRASEALAATRGEEFLGNEVTIKTTAGKVRVDTLVRMPNGADLKAIESKNGPKAGLNDNQKAVFSVLQSTGGEWRGQNAVAAGFKHAAPTGPILVQVDWWDTAPAAATVDIRALAQRALQAGGAGLALDTATQIPVPAQVRIPRGAGQ